MAEGTQADWKRFARWHYRGSDLAFTRRIVLLWHRDEPIGICVFAAPAAALALRSRYFGLHNPRSSVALSALNQQLWLLQRVVLHPIYRGAGIGAAFVRDACESCPVKWIETLSAMGHASPFFEARRLHARGRGDAREACPRALGRLAVRRQGAQRDEGDAIKEQPQRPGVLRVR